MYPSPTPMAGQGTLGAGRMLLLGRLGQMLSGKARLIEQYVAERVKNALLELGHDTDEDGNSSIDALPLPLMDADPFVEAMQEPVEAALRQAAQRLNAGPGGYTPEKIEEEVHAIFAELARVAIEEAFVQRMALAEIDLPPEKTGGSWARKYRRMMAREGRWPVPPETSSTGG
jgi:hypothetical protein